MQEHHLINVKYMSTLLSTSMSLLPPTNYAVFSLELLYRKIPNVVSAFPRFSYWSNLSLLRILIRNVDLRIFHLLFSS